MSQREDNPEALDEGLRKMKSRMRKGATLPALVLAIAAALPAQASDFTPLDTSGRATYLVTFAEPGLLAEHQQSRGAGVRFNYESMGGERNALLATQAAHLSSMKSLLGRRDLAVSHEFLITHSGVALRLSDEEVKKLGSLPGITNIQRERAYQLDTNRGPEFIGAGAIWDGSSFGGAGVDGKGMVAAILDTGIVASHPSFANDATCGHGTSLPNKVLSSLDCSTTSAGICSGPNPGDTNSHGSHTASTVAGNRLSSSAVPAPSTDISGVAPCASIRSYKVCPGNSCPGADITAGLNSVLAHGDADVVNFSISGGANPWNDNDRTFLDIVAQGTFVAASAGNNSATDPTVVGRVNHRGPWVMSVAASTRDGNFEGEVTANGITYPALHGSNSQPGTSVVDMPIRFDPAQPAAAEGCNASGGFPANFFDGSIALIQRGSCAFTEKVNNAIAAGAEKVLIWNNATGGIAPLTPGATDPSVPVYGIEQTSGQAIRAYITSNPPAAVASLEVIESQGDVLGDFSYRGPTPSPLGDLQKPDITGPGVDIYAAGYDAAGPGGAGYTGMSGTSMSSPHIAGAGLLVAQVRPTWTPAEIKSALQLTAHKTGTKEDGVTPWDADDVGSGRARVDRAVQAGFVMDETVANYLAANPASSGDVRTLNLPGLRNRACSPSCSWTRTVRNTLGTASTWTAAGSELSAAARMNITVSPSTFSFTGNTSETQVLTITAAPVDDLSGAIGFGEVVFTEGTSQSPDLHFTVAIQGEPAELDIPRIELDQDQDQFVFVMNPDGTSSQTLNIVNIGTQPLTWNITEATPAAAPRGAYNPAMDEVLTIPNFSVLPTPPVVYNIPGGVTNNGLVVGFTFQGTLTGISGFDYGSDLRMVMTSPDSQSFDVGGFGSTVVNPWDFDGSASASLGTYTSTHIGAFNDAQSTGNWNFSLRHGYSAGNSMSWENVTVTLHKLGVPSVCVDPSDSPWLNVTPVNGTTAPSASSPVTISVDTTGLAAGDYSAIVCVTSNDPTQGLLEVPVSLTVMDGTIEPAAIDVSETAYNFALVGGPAGEADSADLIISNTGDLPLSWVIDTAAGTVGNLGQHQSAATRPVGRQPVLGMSDGSVQVFAEDLVTDASPRATGPNISVEGFTSGGALDSGNPFNTSLVLPIGVGNSVVGLGWQATITAHAPSWRSESKLAFRTNLTDEEWLELGPNVNSSGTSNISSNGIFMLEDGGFDPIQANAAGLLHLDWYEAYEDDLNPDATWADYATGPLLPGLRLICTDQAACDAAVTGTPLPASCDSPSTVPWLNVDPATGLTTGGNSSTVAVSVDASGLAAGTYEALLCVASNDTVNPLIQIPVVLDVTDPPIISVDPASISASVENGDTDNVNLTIANLGDLTLEWDALSSVRGGVAAARRVIWHQGVDETAAAANAANGGYLIWDQEVGGTNGIVSDLFTALGNGVYTSDDFVIGSDQYLAEIFTAGFWNNGDVSNATLIHWYIYPDDGGKPAGNPSDGQNLHVWSMSLAPSDAAVTIDDNNITLDIVAAQGDTIALAAGRYWLVVAPQITTPLADRWNWYQGNPQGEIAKLVDPGNLFGLNQTQWGDLSALVGWNGVAFTLTGGAAPLSCWNPVDMPWLSLDITDGSVDGDDEDTVQVTFSPIGMVPGTYETNICISSNDPANPLVVVPVTLEVPLGADGAIVEGTVQGLGYCSADPQALAGATVQIVGANNTYSVTTNASGYYSQILNINEGPVSVSVTAANHLGDSEAGVVLVAEDRVDVSFDLELDAPCATATPAALGITLAPDAVGSETLSLNNAGAAAYTWTIDIEEILAANPFARGTVDVVADGGFELGEPNPEWDESSAQYGTVLCDQSCVNPGAGFLPHGGDWWVWFGGAAAGDTGYAQQTVTLPVGSSADLRFFLQIPGAPTQSGYLRVSLDGNQLFEVTQANASSYATYQEVVLDVSAYADGGAHVLRFDGVTQGVGDTTNFFLDDVSLLVQPGPLDCADPQGVAWLLVDGDNGTVAAHSSETVDVLYDSTGLSNGSYQANLCVETSDSQNDLIVIPVTLDVISADIFEDGFEGDDVLPRGQADTNRRVRH